MRPGYARLWLEKNALSKLEERVIQFPNSSPTENQKESDGKERPAFVVAVVGIRVRVDGDRKGRRILFAAFAMFVSIAAFVCSVYTRTHRAE